MYLPAQNKKQRIPKSGTFHTKCRPIGDSNNVCSSVTEIRGKYNISFTVDCK